MNNNNRFKFKNWLNLNIQQQWRKLKTEVVDRCPLFRYDDEDDFKFSLKLNNHISNFDSFSLLFETKQNKTHTLVYWNYADDDDEKFHFHFDDDWCVVGW